MKDRLDDYLLLCRCLASDRDPPGLDRLRAQAGSAATDWQRVIDLAEGEMVAPALCRALERKGILEALPAQPRGYLARRLRVNSFRNERIKQQAAELVACLNAIEVVPIVLKGGLHLFESSPEDLGARVMQDLDVVVPRADLERAIEALREIGYRPDDEGENWTYHYRPIARPGALAPVDVHIYLGEQRGFLTPEEAWPQAVRLPGAGPALKALCPTHRVAHNISHSQIQDRGQELGFVWLRQLLDLTAICARYRDEIDWGFVKERLARHSGGDVVTSRLYQAHRLLGLALPAGFVPTLKAKLELQRSLALIRWSGLMRATRLWAGATEPLKRTHIDLIYGCGTRGPRVLAYRLRHALTLLLKYRGQIGSKISQKRDEYG